ncbi:alpha/beta fold hydrolase [Loktanella salsilacus]|jgi:pimeloyl-ACP methyl ester carboxylesterase|uniref:alpha/beta fold hydrolase n=1 Tax=Loktanella salsilacus TaxID=195913 RepID=UPI00370422EF
MFTDQLHPFLTPSAEPVRHDVVHDGQRIPLHFRHGGAQARTLFVTFHGAIDRQTREVPAFMGFLPELQGQAHQISVSDPSMLKDADFGMSWFAGHDGFATQDILPVLFRDLQQALDVDRVVFMGSSGGGFAALFYGWHHPGSVVLAANPQTDLTRYFSRLVAPYRAHCWPALADNADLAQVVTTDVCALYAQSIPSTVIYVQSALDRFHMCNHMGPFFAAMPFRKTAPVVLHADYFGTTGHAFSFEQLSPWVRAILMAPGTGLEDILETRARLQSLTGNASRLPKAASKAAGPGADTRVAMADMLRDIALKGH